MREFFFMILLYNFQTGCISSTKNVSIFELHKQNVNVGSYIIVSKKKKNINDINDDLEFIYMLEHKIFFLV